MIRPDKIIPTSNSTSQEWQEWHTALKKFLGPKQANILFTQAWSARGGVNVRGNTEGLRSYLKDNGLSIETTGIQDIVDFKDSVTNSIGSFFTAGKWITIGAISVVGVSIIMIAYGISKKPETLVMGAKAAAI